MQESTSFKNHFLIATPQLQDPNFARSVALVLEHTDMGAMGIVINHPLDMSLYEVWHQIEIDGKDSESKSKPVYAGGPVQPERGFVVHRPHGVWQSSLEVNKDITITTSKDILEAMAENKGPHDALVALGYAGWEAGQLESEIGQNAWLVCGANAEILFDTPYDLRWQHAAEKLLGVDIIKVSDQIGHA